MSDWRGWGGGGEEETDPHHLKLAFAIGAAAGLLVLLWMFSARSEEERVSSSGFSDVVGGGGVPSPYSSDRRAGSGLGMATLPGSATPASVRPESAPGASEYALQPAAVSTAAAPGTSAAPAAAGTRAAETPPTPQELAAAGVPLDASGLTNLGAQKGLLSALVGRLLDHPKILRAVLDNKLVVDAVMGRETSKRNCSDAGALQSVLSNPGAGPVANLMPLVGAALSRPDTANAFASSELGSRVMACPSVQGLSHSPSGLLAIVTSNPQALSMVTDPRVAQALASNPQGTALLGGVQSTLHGDAH